MKPLTIDQAIAEGYTHVCRDEEFKEISELTDEEKKLKEWYLVSLTPERRSMNEQNLKDLIVEHIEGDDDFYDDDDYVSDALESLDWKTFAEQITERISKRKYLMPTSIRVTF